MLAITPSVFTTIHRLRFKFKSAFFLLIHYLAISQGTKNPAPLVSRRGAGFSGPRELYIYLATYLSFHKRIILSYKISERSESVGWDIFDALKNFLPISFPASAALVLACHVALHSRPFTYKDTGSSVVRFIRLFSFFPSFFPYFILSSPRLAQRQQVEAYPSSRHLLSSYPPPNPLPCTPWPPTSPKYTGALLSLSLSLSLSSTSLLSASISLCCSCCI